MKRCPECRRDYTDDTLSFCLEDGTALVYGVSADEPATEILHSTASPGEGATRAQIHMTDRTAVFPGTGEVVVTKRRRPSALLIGVPVAIVAILAAGFFGYRYFTSASSKQIESIAIMPFVNESGNADIEYLSDGMTETLITSLSQLPNLNVKPRSSVFRYKGRESDTATIGKELNVQAILNGRVVQRGQDLSLFVELIDVALEKVVWSHRYDRKQIEIVTIQTDVARDLSNRLKSDLSGTDEAKVTKTYTTNPEAYQLYLQGSYYKDKYNQDGYKKAIEFYDKAIEKDPNYALAYVGKGYAYNTAANWYLPSSEAMPKAQAAGLKAVELDPSLADAYALLGIYEVWWGLDWPACERNFKKAIELGSPRANDGYGYYLMAMGKLDQAAAEFKVAQSLNPLSLNVNSNAAFGYLCTGRYDEALEQARKTIELDPNYWAGYMTLGLAYERKRQYPEAIAALEKARSLDNNPDNLGYLGYVYGVSGRTAEAQKLLDEMKRPTPGSYVSAGAIASVYAGLGDKDKTFEWLNKALEEHSGAIVNVDPPFQNLRSDPRFKELLKKLNLPE
jgi:TolB-like protein/Tfp pilus assembly protein PilF